MRRRLNTLIVLSTLLVLLLAGCSEVASSHSSERHNLEPVRHGPFQTNIRAEAYAGTDSY